MALNVIALQGRLVRDPELRKTGSGKSVASFTIAVDRGKEKVTDFIPCVAWEKNGEFVDKYFLKGDPILVQGKLQTRQYEDRDGHNRTVFEVLVREVSFCGSKSRPVEASHAETNPAEGFTPVDDDEELPF